MVDGKNRLRLRRELDFCFQSFHQRTTHRGDFSKKVLAILRQHSVATGLDEKIVYESIAGSKKTSLSFIESLIGGLAMTNRRKTAKNFAREVLGAFPELEW